MSLGSCHGLVNMGHNLGRHGVVERVECLGHLGCVKVEVFQALASFEQLIADFAHCLHIYIDFYSKLVGEEINQLYGRSG